MDKIKNTQQLDNIYSILTNINRSNHFEHSKLTELKYMKNEITDLIDDLINTRRSKMGFFQVTIKNKHYLQVIKEFDLTEYLHNDNSIVFKCLPVVEIDNLLDMNDEEFLRFSSLKSILDMQEIYHQKNIEVSKIGKFVTGESITMTFDPNDEFFEEIIYTRPERLSKRINRLLGVINSVYFTHLDYDNYINYFNMELVSSEDITEYKNDNIKLTLKCKKVRGIKTKVFLYEILSISTNFKDIDKLNQDIYYYQADSLKLLEYIPKENENNYFSMFRRTDDIPTIKKQLVLNTEALTGEIL